VAQTFGASHLKILFRVAIPSALPMIFTGLKVSLNIAWATLVAAEMLGAVSGLGFMMQMGRMNIRPDIIIIGMLLIGTIGLIMSTCLDVIEEKYIK
jgi:NitT/TauT family transport system permease protein/taurine transport system permease protein